MFNRKNNQRKMKKIFQWRDYLNWKKMSSAQKINFKRACLFPFFSLCSLFFPVEIFDFYSYCYWNLLLYKI